MYRPILIEEPMVQEIALYNAILRTKCCELTARTSFLWNLTNQIVNIFKENIILLIVARSL